MAYCGLCAQNLGCLGFGLKACFFGVNCKHSHSISSVTPKQAQEFIASRLDLNPSEVPWGSLPYEGFKGCPCKNQVSRILKMPGKGTCDTQNYCGTFAHLPDGSTPTPIQQALFVYLLFLKIKSKMEEKQEVNFTTNMMEGLNVSQEGGRGGRGGHGGRGGRGRGRGRGRGGRGGQEGDQEGGQKGGQEGDQ